MWPVIGWFLGAIADEQERSFDVALGFLAPGRRYRAEIYRDGDHASGEQGYGGFGADG